MLQPTEYFTAKEICFLQNEASEWIHYVNQKIIEAASDGKSEVYIDITPRSPVGNKYWLAPDVLIEHFKNRGFIHQFNGQSSCIFEWTPEKPKAESKPFEFNGEPVDEEGLRSRIKNFLFGDQKKDGTNG